MQIINKAHKKAFSLIEAAIVLAIIGLVIGGIWAAASMVRTNTTASRLYSDLLVIRDGMWQVYKGVDLPSFTPVADTIYQAGVVPKDWQWNGVSGLGAAITSPSGIKFWMYTEYDNIPKMFASVGDGPGKVSRSVCLLMVRKFYPVDNWTMENAEIMRHKNGGITSGSTCNVGSQLQFDFWRETL